jgi:hypothetical protein
MNNVISKISITIKNETHRDIRGKMSIYIHDLTFNAFFWRTSRLVSNNILDVVKNSIIPIGIFIEEKATLQNYETAYNGLIGD